MNEREQEGMLPRLEVAGVRVPFPERGHSLYLRLEDLKTFDDAAASGKQPGLLLFRAESGVCGVVPSKLAVRRANVMTVGLTVLHHCDRIEIDGREARFFEVARTALQAGNRAVGTLCPFCQSEYVGGGAIYHCPLCGAAYHEDCWAELNFKRCCTRNCAFSPQLENEAF